MKFLQIVEDHIRLKDQINGAEMSINVHGDQIKTFLKKLAFNKSDILQITEKAKEDIQKYFAEMRVKFEGMEEKITKAASSVQILENTTNVGEYSLHTLENNGTNQSAGYNLTTRALGISGLHSPLQQALDSQRSSHESNERNYNFNANNSIFNS